MKYTKPFRKRERKFFKYDDLVVYEGDKIYNMYSGRKDFGVVRNTHEGWVVRDYSGYDLFLVLVLQNPKIKINTP